MNSYKYRHQRPYKNGDKVWYQNRDSSSWSGPAVVVDPDSNVVWLRAGGDVKKVAEHKVQPFGNLDEDSDEIENEMIDNKNEKDDSDPSVANDSENSVESEEGVVTRSKSKRKNIEFVGLVLEDGENDKTDEDYLKDDKKLDNIGAYYLQLGHNDEMIFDKEHFQIDNNPESNNIVKKLVDIVENMGKRLVDIENRNEN